MPPTYHFPLQSDLGIAEVKRFRPYSLWGEQTEFMPFRKRLRRLIYREQLDEAIQLFRQLVESNRFSLELVWQVGAEIIGKLSPEHIIDYLKAVYISSSERKSLVTFNAYLDMLLEANEYSEAFSEIEIRHKNANYSHPIILRKYALCAYQLWLQKYNEIPDDYFEDFETKYLPSGYSTLESKTASLLDEIHSILPTDNELCLTYLQFLKYTQNDQKIELVTRKSLLVCLLEDNLSLIIYLLQHYYDVIDDDTREKALIYLYEKDPTVEEGIGLSIYIDIMAKKLDEARHSISIITKKAQPETHDVKEYINTKQELIDDRDDEYSKDDEKYENEGGEEHEDDEGDGDHGDNDQYDNNPKETKNEYNGSINQEPQSLNDVDLIATTMITVFLNRIQVGSFSPHFMKVLKNKVFDKPSGAVIAHCIELDFIGQVRDLLSNVNNSNMIETLRLVQDKLDNKNKKGKNNTFDVTDYSFHPLF